MLAIDGVEAEGEDVDVWGGGVDVDCGGDELVVVDPEGGGGAPAVMVHDLTNWTRGSPFAPVTGVNVRVHVSVTGPASVWVVRTVCVVNGCGGVFPFP